MSGRHPSEWVADIPRNRWTACIGNHHVGHGDLNANQRQAVDWGGGPLLVLAGPGSGRTEVRAFRIVRLLEEDGNASALALTSTNKAAAEMRDRVDRHLGGHTDRALFSTFYAFAADILGQHGGHLGIRPDIQLLTRDEDRIAILEDVIRNLPGGDYELPRDRTNLLHLIDRVFSESYGGEGPSSSLTSTPEWLTPLFRRYRDALVAANLRPLPSMRPRPEGMECDLDSGVQGCSQERSSTADDGCPPQLPFSGEQERAKAFRFRATPIQVLL